MTLLFFAKYPFSPRSGGVERFSVTWGNKFKSDGHRIIYLSWGKNENSKTAIEGQRYLKDHSSFDSDANISELHQILIAEGVEILFNQQGDSAAFTRLLNQARQGTITKLISILHFEPEHPLKMFSASIPEILKSGMPMKEQIKYLLRNSSLRKLQMQKIVRHTNHYVYDTSDAVVLLSERFIEDYRKWAEISDDSKLFAIPNPSTFEYSDLDINKRKEVIWVGRLTFMEKRPDLMLKIWKRVQDAFPDWTLTILGTGDYEKPMKQLIDRWGLKRVNRMGQVDPRPYYERASILCVTSNTEGFGLVIVEASDAEVVPMAFDSYASVKDVIIDGESGFLIPPFDLDKYAEKLCELMSNEDLRMRMGEKARLHAQTFDVERIAPMWYNLFDKVRS